MGHWQDPLALPRESRHCRPALTRFLAALVVAIIGSLTAIDDASAARGRRVRASIRHERRPAAAGGVPAASPVSRAAAAHSGRVTFVTEKRAYVDRGTRDGLAARQKLQLLRGGRPVATCVIETAGDHDATCVGARPRVGDTFRASGPTGPATPPPAALPAVIDPATLAERANAVAESSYEKVDFNGRRKLGARSHAWVSPGFVVWQSGDGQDYSQQRIDGAIAVLDIAGTGMRFDAAFSAQRWSTPAVNRFSPGTGAQFYLWQAEASRRTEEANTVFAVGRLWTWHLPGLPLLDGLQIGHQNRSGTVEAGVYGGLIPTAIGIVPSTNLWTVGLYGSAVEHGNGGSFVRVARQEARLGVWHAATTGMVSEAEGLTETWLGPFSLGGGGRLRLAPSVSSQPMIERAFFDLGFRPSLALVGSAHIRYFGKALSEEAPLRAMTPTLAGGLHATGDLRWDVATWLGFAVLAGTNRDRASDFAQSYGAMELRLPRCFGDLGGLWLGAEGQEGWLRGRALYVQAFGRMAERLHALVRVTANATEFQTPDRTPNLRELDTYFNVDGALATWLRMRAWSFVRLPYTVQGESPPEATVGIAFGASATGIF